PGNVRELINVIQRCTILSEKACISLPFLPPEISQQRQLPPAQPLSNSAVTSTISASDAAISTGLDSLPSSSALALGSQDADSGGLAKLDDIARTHVIEALRQSGGNKAKAARILGIHRRKLYRLLEKYEIDESTF
ncbi:MAG TPA: sigma-54-dependent Fis family transcriptional regulator, partial [Planctomycetaceae bacterium]|nr:sigma-54-dependent Fis family transcriptional regulator [Planctomycetaceae bacterium]